MNEIQKEVLKIKKLCLQALEENKKVLVVLTDGEGILTYTGRITEINESDDVVKLSYDGGARWFSFKDIIDVSEV